jgi:hypothetical protein
MDLLRLRLIYDGVGPVHWTASAGAFGLQDKGEGLLEGRSCSKDTVVFEVTLRVNAGGSGELVLSGDFAHGPPAGRFLYLSWRNPGGHGYAQRLKLPLSGIHWDLVRNASARDVAVVARLLDHDPRATSTGANIGGTRSIEWGLQ